MAEYTCIVCPNSCLISVEETAGGLEITGNKCRRGLKFAEDEHTHPKRMFTSCVKIEGALVPRISVITTGEVPKEKLFDCQQALRNVSVKAPVHCGDVIIKDICSAGVDLVASRSLDAAEK